MNRRARITTPESERNREDPDRAHPCYNRPVIPRRSTLIIVLLLGQLHLRAAVAAQDEITIDRKEPTSERILFDPKSPPPDMPKLKAGEAALCQYNFDCKVNLGYEIVSEDHAGGGSGNGTAHGAVTVAAKLRRVRVTITLHSRIYIPRGANAKIRAHEEGHRIVNERAYEEAQAAARAAAMEVLTQTWTGTGDTPDAAGKDATDNAVKALCDGYLSHTAAVASRVGDIYDELTRHGTNLRLKESDAVEQAFAKYKQDPAATAPATTPAAPTTAITPTTNPRG